jgi:asparagine N-glycosylation enzyme membrane subunit Stt3
MNQLTNPFPTPIRSLRIQKNRQALTTLSLVFLVLAVILALSSLGLLALLAVISSMVIGVVLHFATRNIANAMNIITDERERSLRDHAHRIAYWVMSGILGGILGGIAGFISTREAEQVLVLVKDFGRLEIQVLLLSFAAIFLGLPTAIIAWLEPNPVDD